MQLLFTTSDSLSSRLITGFDSGGVSHGGIAFDDVRPGEVLDTTWTHGGVRWWPRADWLRMHGRRLVAQIDLPLPDESGAYLWALDQVGKPYDWTAIFGMAILRDWQHDDSWYCFELQIATALAGGMRLAGKTAEIGGRLAREIAHAWSLGRDVTLHPDAYSHGQ